MENNEERKPFIRSNDYHRLFDLQVREVSEGSNSENKMTVYGKPIVFNSKTLLFRAGDIDVYEIIDQHALDNTDTSNCFFKYNHSDEVMVMGRTKNGTLRLEKRDDGMWIEDDLPNTTAGRDLYELIKRGDIDKMSFAFTIDEESRDESVEGEVTYRVMKIGKLYDVAAVPLPAYEDTQLFARRRQDVEALRQEMEISKNLAKETELKLARARAGFIVAQDEKSIKKEK